MRMASERGMAGERDMANDPATPGVEVRAVEHPEADPGRRALECLDRLFAEKPTEGTTRAERRDLGHDFSETTRLMCGYRDVLIRAQRAAGVTSASQARLQQVNSVLSTVLGGHFPLGDIPWRQVEQARDAFAALLVQG